MNDVLAHQNAAICVNGELLFPDIEYDTTAWQLLVLDVARDFAVVLKFGPVVDMADRTGKAVAVPLGLGKWCTVNDKATIVEPKKSYHRRARISPGGFRFACIHDYSLYKFKSRGFEFTLASAFSKESCG